MGFVDIPMNSFPLDVDIQWHDIGKKEKGLSKITGVLQIKTRLKKSSTLDT